MICKLIFRNGTRFFLQTKLYNILLELQNVMILSNCDLNFGAKTYVLSKSVVEGRPALLIYNHNGVELNCCDQCARTSMIQESFVDQGTINL